jgi:hypothetical protein
MVNYYYQDENGQPVRCETVTEWGQKFEKQDRLIAATVEGDVRVSTVFLGLDHGWGGGDPVLWETMVFGGPHDGYQDRYTSRQDALAGHEKAVAMVRDTATAPPD